ncbi:MAG: fibronectin type III domain-containing protein [Flavobacteriales bacterium]|nr:fibronectin type III domain-containing protein [Flavobacteriales bacterium]
MITTLLLILFSYNVQGQCPTNLVEDPQQFQWTFHPISATNPEPYYSGVMEVGETTLTMNNGETFTTRAYRQKGTDYTVPGPTINVIPGNKYVLSLHNTLPFEALNPSHNVFKDPNAVNIHTHGLHISGESPGDDVTRVFEGGKGGDFVWDIPADHIGGTYWYHAHHHGATYLQVAGGMLGMLIVDDSNDGLPANVAGMEERQLLFAKLDPSAAGTGGDNLMGGSLSSATWTTNGIIGGNICMPANTWQHWRVLVADPNAMLRDVEFGPECEVMVLARDGVWRTVTPKDLATNKLQLTGASRADFAIRTTGNSWVKVGGNIMANIHVNGTPDATVHPFDTDGVSTWSAIRPSYLRDLRSETNVNMESVSMGARTVDGSKFNHMEANYTLPTTQVQEWSISGNVRHPFHLHIYHIQALEDDRDFEAGEFYDVMASQMTVRFDLNQATTTPYAGKTIMHCHILEHEDQGAMGWLDVQGGTGAPTFPNDANVTTPYSEYYTFNTAPVTIPAAPTTLSATAVSSSSIDLAWTDNATDENGYNIERSIDGTNFSLVGSVGTDVVTYSDNALNALTLYYYRVVAFNSAGSSSYSNIANATTLENTIPSAPTTLSATANSSSSISLDWTDNASDEDGYYIERSEDGTTFSLVASVGTDVVAYDDNSLTELTTYYYRVFAYNVVGNSSTSNVANATTLEVSVDPIIHVENITVTREAINGNRFRGVATVTIFDAVGVPVSGATVNGNFSGTTTSSVSGVTDANGQIVLLTAGKKNPSGEWCLEVTNVSLAGSIYDPLSNVLTIACESAGAKSIMNSESNGVKESLTGLAVYPNPFNGSTEISFEIKEATEILLEVYSVNGTKVAMITNLNFEKGQHVIKWDSDNLVEGTYFLKLRAGNQLDTKRLMILR